MPCVVSISNCHSHACPCNRAPPPPRHYTTLHRYELGVTRMPLEYADAAPRPVKDKNKNYIDPKLYIPAPLHEGADTWRPDWMKCWEGWNQLAYSF